MAGHDDDVASRPSSANAVVAYDPRWPALFSDIEARVTPALIGTGYAVEHVGSTSVPGLAAKPIIDVHVAAPSAAQIADAVDRLSRLGYLHEGDGDIAGREVMKPPPDMPYHHMYVVATGSKPHLDQVLFRDYLRSNADAAATYAERKRAVSHLITPTSRADYVDAKSATVTGILREARTTFLRARSFDGADEASVRALLTDWFEQLTPGNVHTEVEERMDALARARRATVVVHDDTVLGVGAISDEDVDADLAVDCERAVEVFCVYVRRDAMHQGIGSALLADLETHALTLGFTDLIAISGARHRSIGYPFWNARFGEPIRVDENYWGDRAERVVWRGRLTR